jgi:hypothetical protein
MRRMLQVVSGVALGFAVMTPTALIGAEQAQNVAVVDKTMKVIGPAYGATRKALTAKSMAEAKTNAETVSKAFVETEAFFKSHGKADGVEWSQSAKKAADTIAKAADPEGASAAAAELGKLCTGCHAKYRDRAADGTYTYKPGN